MTCGFLTGIKSTNFRGDCKMDDLVGQTFLKNFVKTKNIRTFAGL